MPVYTSSDRIYEALWNYRYFIASSRSASRSSYYTSLYKSSTSTDMIHHEIEIDYGIGNVGSSDNNGLRLIFEVWICKKLSVTLESVATGSLFNIVCWKKASNKPKKNPITIVYRILE